MINIIKQGKNIKTAKIIYGITCPRCNCEFECEGSDFTSIEKSITYIKERSINGKATIQCPCCQTTIELNYNQIPQRLEDIE